MKRLQRREFLKHAAMASVGGVLCVRSPSEATRAQGSQSSPIAGPPLPDDVVVGAIRKKWLALGGAQGFLGRPLTPELTTPDGVGRYNHFNGGSIYWTPRTGAHEIHGSIRGKWSKLGWERSWLGYPVTDEVDFTEGGRVSTFEHGHIYWWPDTGAIELNNVIVNYTGIVCFREMNWDQASNSDEPYAIIGVVSPTDTWAIRTKVYKDIVPA